MIRLLNTSLVALTVILSSASASAQVNMTGEWAGSSVAGGGTYANTFSFVQKGNKVIGSAMAGTAPGVITGTVSGDQLPFHSEYKSIVYSSDAIATTDGISMSGTFLDSQNTAGTFSAQKISPVLTANYVVPNPPVLQVKKSKAKVYCIRFVSVAQSTSTTFARANAAKTKIRYTFNIKGAAKRTIQSNRNMTTLENLPAGNYRATCKASAIKNEKRLFGSRTSPTAVFTIRSTT